MIRQTKELIVERAGEDGYNWYKVPGISANEAGTLFCYYEARAEEKGNLQDKALFYRTGAGGQEWSACIAAVC